MDPSLKSLKSSQLLSIFKAFDREKKGKLTQSDLDYIFSELLGSKRTEEELYFTLRHLTSLGTPTYSGTTGTIHDSKAENIELDFSTFIDAVNGTLRRQPLECILRGTFDKLTKGNKTISIDDLLELAKKSNIRVGDDARVRLATRMPNGVADFKEFVKCVAGM